MVKMPVRHQYINTEFSTGQIKLLQRPPEESYLGTGNHLEKDVDI